MPQFHFTQLHYTGRVACGLIVKEALEFELRNFRFEFDVDFYQQIEMKRMHNKVSKSVGSLTKES